MHHGDASPTHHSLPPPPRRKNGQFFHKDLGVRYKTNGMFARPIGVSPCPPPVFPFPPLVQALLPMAAAAPAALASPAARDLDAMNVDRAPARALGLCYRCKKPGHITHDCQEKNVKDVIRGLNVADLKADLKEIANIVATQALFPLSSPLYRPLHPSPPFIHASPVDSGRIPFGADAHRRGTPSARRRRAATAPDPHRSMARRSPDPSLIYRRVCLSLYFRFELVYPPTIHSSLPSPSAR
ncbi:hypothetical protein AURDEDRAFT_173132 [Auricularia subglabra TFB-10046 SS5]|nr:hypothetical protein AURDEDRAFT_173132 [Auricularia subglabra TFB-10046 SS5]